MSNSLTLTEETYALTVVEGDDLQLTLSGEQGPSGPNTVSTSTTTALNGYIYGNGTNVAGATAAATASNPNTLVLRDALGASEFGGISTNGQVEFNGVDAGDSLTFNMVNYFYGTGAAAAHRTALGVGTTDAPTFAGATFAAGTITTSQPLSITQTWNNAATTFTGLQVIVTDTASDAASLLMDLRVGGGSQFRVLKNGATFANFAVINGLTSMVGVDLAYQRSGISIGASGLLGFSSGNISTNRDTILARDAANTLAQRNGLNEQESRIYGTYTDGSNYRRLALKMSSAGVAQIVAEGLGSGAAGNRIEIDGLRIGKGGGAIATNTALGNAALAVNTTGSFNTAVGNAALAVNTTGVDNTAIGTSSLALNTTGSQNSSVGRLSLSNLSSGGYNVSFGSNAGRFISGGAALSNSTNSVYIGSDTKALASGQTNQIVIGHNATGIGSNTAVLGNDSIVTTALKGNVGIGTTSPSAKLDVVGTFNVTGASTFGDLIEQRNGTAAQESRIYGTYTDGSNYRRLALKMSSAGVAQIVAEGLGSGAAGNRIEIDGLRIGKGGGAIATNTALGASALNANTTGTDNAAVGYQSLIANTTGSRNSSSGTSSLFANTTGSDNTALGTFALFTNVSSSENVAVGSRALLSNIGASNTAVGYQSLTGSTTGTSNSAIGVRSGRFIADGSTANAVTTNSVYLGAETKALASGQTNQIVIGHSATGLGSNTAVLGNDSIVTTALKGNVGIGTTSPASKLDVVGAIKASGTVQTGGYTFATLPTPTQGMRAYITDGAAIPIFMANASGGGSTVTPVFYNGTNWINA